MFYSDLKIILASSSPRRKALLHRLGFTIDVIAPNIEEAILPNQTHEDYVMCNAMLKARTVLDKISIEFKHKDYLLIAADTIVVLNNRLFGKPKDEKEAKIMLKNLSGKAHMVLSGLYVMYHTISNKIQERTICVSSKVYIKSLSDQEIDRYVLSGEPMDKAGAYAAQGIGAYMIQKIEGSYTNVVGLPLCELITILMEDFNLQII